MTTKVHKMLWHTVTTSTEDANALRILRPNCQLSTKPGDLNGSAPFGFVLPKRLACRVGKGGGTDAPHGKVSRAPCPPSASMRLARPMVGTAHERQSFELKRVPTPLPTLQAGTRLWFRFAKS